MESREIKIITSRGNAGTINSSAEKLSDLFPRLSDMGINTESMRFLINADLELTNRDAKLPEGNFKLYISAKQTKSGYAVFENEQDDDREVNIYKALENLHQRVSDLESKVLSQSYAKSPSFEDDEDLRIMREIENQ